MRQLLEFHRIISPQQTPLLLILVTGEKEVFPPPPPSASQNGPISRLASSNSLKGFLVLSTSLAAVAAFLQQQRRRRRRRLWPQQPPHPPKGKFAKGRPRARGRSPKFQFVQRGVTSQPPKKTPFQCLVEMESSLARARKPDGSTRFFSARLGPSPIFSDLILYEKSG